MRKNKRIMENKTAIFHNQSIFKLLFSLIFAFSLAAALAFAADVTAKAGDLYVDGNMGIGIPAPASRLHVQDGAALFNGTTGTTPMEGAGTRLMWIPAKAAFRAGSVEGTQWDDANIGDYSFASGYNTTSSGHYSTAIGYNTTASGDYSTAMGAGSTALGYASTAIGFITTASINGATAMGYGTDALGWYSTTMGMYTSASGDGSTAMGRDTNASGNYSTAMGRQTTASNWYSTAMGYQTTASGKYSTAIGNGITCSQENATCISHRLGIGTGTPESLLQTGTSTGTNEINLSGVLYVNGTAKRVGIGIIAPTATLDIVSQDTVPLFLTRYISSGATGGQTAFRIARGTIASPSQMLVNDQLWGAGVSGYHGGNAFTTGGNRVYTAYYAGENWNDATHNGAYISWGTSHRATGGTGATHNHMILTPSGTLWLGEGDNSPVIDEDFVEVSKLHLDMRNLSVNIRFTANATTGRTASDGFTIGINESGTAELNQRENLPINFYVNNTLVMTLHNSTLGVLGTGDTNPLLKIESSSVLHGYPKMFEIVTDDSASDPSLRFYRQTPGNGDFSFMISGGGADSFLSVFSSPEAATTYRGQLTLSGDGQKVGIGTTNPTHTLNVVGDGNFTGDVIIEGSLIGGSPIKLAKDEILGYTTICVWDEDGYWDLIYWKNGQQKVAKDTSRCG